MNRSEWNKLSKQGQDEQLRQYAQEAQKYPQASLARRQALDKLIRLVINSERLYRPSKNRLPPQCQGGYREIYNDALQSLMLYLCQNIHQYDPERASVMAWINMLMDRRFIPVGIRQFQDGRERRLGKRHRLQELIRAEEDIPARENKSDNKYLELKNFLLEDPQNQLQNRTLRGRPDASLQILLLRKLEGQTWNEIAHEFEIPLPTLHSFFRRSLEKLGSYLQEYLDI